MEIRYTNKVDICFKPSKPLRQELAKPYGLIAREKEDILSLLSRFKGYGVVGDYVTRILYEENIEPAIFVVDGYTRRHERVKLDGSKALVLRNEAGILRYSTLITLQNIVLTLSGVQRFLVEVDGEEDMLALPLIMLLPTQFAIVYGQPNVGSVIVEVNRYTKWIAYDLLRRMDIINC